MEINMKQIVVASSSYHLQELIKDEMNLYGNRCDLNHIDISKIDDLYGLFSSSDFNGDISKWNVSHVKSMNNMFSSSRFNGDISKWDVSRVKNMGWMFYESDFKGNLNNWKPFNIEYFEGIFDKCIIDVPYWANFEDKEKRKTAIENYWLEKELNKELGDNSNSRKRIKL
jgi:hypothetical protein